MCQTVCVLVCVGHLRAQGSPHNETIIQLCSQVLLQEVCFIFVNANVSKRHAIQKQCTQPVYACEQDACKL